MRCKKCLKDGILKSELKQYTFYCSFCDEDLFSFEVE